MRQRWWSSTPHACRVRTVQVFLEVLALGPYRPSASDMLWLTTGNAQRKQQLCCTNWNKD